MFKRAREKVIKKQNSILRKRNLHLTSQQLGRIL